MAQAINRKTFSKERINEWKKDVIDLETFKTLIPEQQEELFNAYEKQFQAKELAELWGCKKQYIYNMKSQLKLRHEKQAKKEKKETAKKEVKKEVKQMKEEVAVTSSPFVQERKGKSISELAQEVAQVVFETKKEEVPVPEVQQPTFDMSQVVEQMRSMMQEQLNQFKKEQENLPAPVTVQNLYDAMELVVDDKKQKQEDEDEDLDGISFKFSGIHDAARLSKKLKKVLTLIEGEDSRYEIEFSIKERPQLLEAEAVEVEETDPQLKETVAEMQEQMKKLQQELEEEKKKDPMEMWREGYGALKNETEGEEDVKKKEATEPPKYRPGVIGTNGKSKYQTFYICTDCGHKGKHHLYNGTVYCNCKECGKRMRLREAVKDKHLEADSFGNFFIAGKFKREDEVLKEKPLVEVWNIQ